MPASKEHSPPVECGAGDWSGQQKNASQRGALTNCRAHSEGPVRTAKESQPMQGHSLPVERRARDWSGQREEASQRGELTLCQAQIKGLVRTGRESQPTRGTHPLSIAG
jgi:hypothetical protein